MQMFSVIFKRSVVFKKGIYWQVAICKKTKSKIQQQFSQNIKIKKKKTGIEKNNILRNYFERIQFQELISEE